MIPFITYAEVDRASLEEMKKAVDRLTQETRRTVPQAVLYSGIRICVSAAAASKPGTAKRRVLENSEFRQAKPALKWARSMQKKGKRIPAEAQAALDTVKEIAPYSIEKMRQKHMPLMLPTFAKYDIRRMVPVFNPATGEPGRGLAKHVWVVMKAKLASRSRGGGFNASENDANWNYVIAVKDNNGTYIYSIKILDKLSYIEKWKPGFAQNVLVTAAHGIEGYLNHQLDDAIKKAQIQ